MNGKIIPNRDWIHFGGQRGERIVCDRYGAFYDLGLPNGAGKVGRMIIDFCKHHRGCKLQPQEVPS